MAKKPFTPVPPMAELPPAEEIDVKDILEKYLDGEIDLICVLGPTASGKTRYAVSLARQINALLEKLHKSIDEYDGAELTEQSRMTLGEWLDIWLVDCAEPTVRPTTIKGYRGYV